MPMPLKDQLAIAIGADPGRDYDTTAISIMPIIEHHVAKSVQQARVTAHHIWELLYTEDGELPYTELICRTAAEAIEYVAMENSNPFEPPQWEHDGKGRLRAEDSSAGQWTLRVVWL